MGGEYLSGVDADAVVRLRVQRGEVKRLACVSIVHLRCGVWGLGLNPTPKPYPKPKPQTLNPTPPIHNPDGGSQTFCLCLFMVHGVRVLEALWFRGLGF